MKTTQGRSEPSARYREIDAPSSHRPCRCRRTSRCLRRSRRHRVRSQSKLCNQHPLLYWFSRPALDDYLL